MIPKPKVKDLVERCDFSRMLGKVIKIVDNKHVIVRWHDGKKHYHVFNVGKNAMDVLKPTDTKEKIKDLALLRRYKWT